VRGGKGRSGLYREEGLVYHALGERQQCVILALKAIHGGEDEIFDSAERGAVVHCKSSYYIGLRERRKATSVRGSGKAETCGLPGGSRKIWKAVDLTKTPRRSQLGGAGRSAAVKLPHSHGSVPRSPCMERGETSAHIRP